MCKRRFILLFCVLSLVLPNLFYAETIFLNNGSVVRGTIEYESDYKITVSLSQNRISIFKSAILYIDYNSKIPTRMIMSEEALNQLLSNINTININTINETDSQTHIDDERIIQEQKNTSEKKSSNQKNIFTQGCPTPFTHWNIGFSIGVASSSNFAIGPGLFANMRINPSISINFESNFGLLEFDATAIGFGMNLRFYIPIKANRWYAYLGIGWYNQFYSEHNYTMIESRTNEYYSFLSFPISLLCFESDIIFFDFGFTQILINPHLIDVTVDWTRISFKF